ncbi:MAG: hypothetical protein Kapaf2KO_20270 [Candidatus Kapaibacteriales bacterium]
MRCVYFLAITLSFFVLGCGGEANEDPSDISVKEALEANYTSIKTLFATNRKPISDNKLVFTSKRDSLKYGICYVTIPNDHEVGEIEAPKWWKFEFSESFDNHITLKDIKLVSKEDFFTNESSHFKERVMLFIHGYNVSFEDAAKRTGQMTYDLQFDGIPIFFSWPSNGSIAKYFHDSENIKYSTKHIKRLIFEIIEKYQGHEIYLIAHSMGSRGLARALVELYQENETYRDRINHIILAAPDIDAQIFVEDIAPRIIGSKQNLTLYSSSKDKALYASKEINGFPRAGDSGDGLILLEGIETIDASNLETGLFSHSYFGNTRTVLYDIDLILDHGHNAEARSGLMSKTKDTKVYWEFMK